MSYVKPVGETIKTCSLTLQNHLSVSCATPFNLQDAVHDFVAEGFGSMLVQIAQAVLNLLFTPDVIQADGQPVDQQVSE